MQFNGKRFYIKQKLLCYTGRGWTLLIVLSRIQINSEFKMVASEIETFGRICSIVATWKVDTWNQESLVIEEEQRIKPRVESSLMKYLKSLV